MKEFTYVITDKEGIHARPAGELVKLAKSYASSVAVIKEGKKADAKKVLGLWGLVSNKVWKLQYRWKARMRIQRQQLWRHF